jgi:tRNA-modifying protein YgfZ
MMIETTPATMLADRNVIRLAGEDVRGFLQSLVTNDVVGGLPVYAGLLTPQGKTLFDFIVWADHDDLLIDCEASQADALIRRLSMYRLRRAITIARDPVLVVNWSKSLPDAGVKHRNIDMGPWPIGIPHDPRGDALGWRWLAPPLGDDTSAAWHAHRLSLGVPEGAIELGQDQSLWLETNARELNGVSFTKGCYIGQENTARMHHRGKVNRRLAVVDAPVAPDGARAWYPALGKAVVVERG